jgi:hemolysin III
MAQAKIKRPQTFGEEVANTVSHGVGALLSAGGAALLIGKAVVSGSSRAVVGMSLYGASLIALYVASTVYHAAKDPAWKKKLRIMDHCSIFLLILGTYIPIALLTLGGSLGWVLIAVNTALAVLGIALKMIDLNRFAKVSILLYALMGWLVMPAFKTVVHVIPAAGVMLLLSGGVAYTAGIGFYKSGKHYMHFVWHLFVLLGSVLQYLCVWLYCL